MKYNTRLGRALIHGMCGNWYEWFHCHYRFPFWADFFVDILQNKINNALRVPRCPYHARKSSTRGPIIVCLSVWIGKTTQMALWALSNRFLTLPTIFEKLGLGLVTISLSPYDKHRNFFSMLLTTKSLLSHRNAVRKWEWRGIGDKEWKEHAQSRWSKAPPDKGGHGPRRTGMETKQFLHFLKYSIV